MSGSRWMFYSQSWWLRSKNENRNKQGLNCDGETTRPEHLWKLLLLYRSSRSAVVLFQPSRPKKEQQWTGDSIMGRRGLTIWHEEQKLAHAVSYNSRVTGAQSGKKKKNHAGSDGTVSELIVHGSLWTQGSAQPWIGQGAHAVSCPPLKAQQWTGKHQNSATEQ